RRLFSSVTQVVSDSLQHHEPQYARIDVSCLTWEGQQFQGKAAILEKLSSLPFQKIQHSITVEDCQPTPSICTISIVVGQLKMFLLKNIDDAWVCTNDMLRLALHNFG
ncbi:hypothetical protein K5549_020420, partial [Capra hircus]